MSRCRVSIVTGKQNQTYQKWVGVILISTDQFSLPSYTSNISIRQFLGLDKTKYLNGDFPRRYNILTSSDILDSRLWRWYCEELMWKHDWQPISQRSLLKKDFGKRLHLRSLAMCGHLVFKKLSLSADS